MISCDENCLKINFEDLQHEYGVEMSNRSIKLYYDNPNCSAQATLQDHYYDAQGWYKYFEVAN